MIKNNKPWTKKEVSQYFVSVSPFAKRNMKKNGI